MGEGQHFYNFLFEEVDKYIKGEEFCPFAVCGGVRVRVEMLAYSELQNEDHKTTFLETNMTRPKLEVADKMGIDIPDSHFLLGIIYNDGMHWKNNYDNVSPIASKLEHKTIAKLIRDIFEQEI